MEPTDNSVKIKWGKTTFGEIELRTTGSGQHCKNPTKERISLLGEKYPISGNATPCLGEPQVYSTDLVNGATYRWSVPRSLHLSGSGNKPGQCSMEWSWYFKNNCCY